MRRFLECLCASEEVGKVHLILSESALHVLEQELDVQRGSHLLTQLLGEEVSERLICLHENTNFLAPPSSGSYPHDGMVIIPASMGNLAAIAMGSSDTLIERAADVALKEKRRLIVVPREAPLSVIHLRNLLTLAEAGVTVIPAMLSFYQHPRSVEDLIDHVVARVLDHLQIKHAISRRWGKDIS